MRRKEDCMAVRIIKDSNKKRPIYFRRCHLCGCEFEFEKEDVKEEIYDQRERYNVLFVTCPCCGRDIGCREKIIRYEQ